VTGSLAAVRKPRRGSMGIVVAMALLMSATQLSAQVPDTSKKPKPTPRDSAIVDTLQKQAQRRVIREAHKIRLTEALIAVGGVAVISTLDRSLQRTTQRYREKHEGGTLADAAALFRHEGEPIWYAGTSLGVMAVGYIANSAPIRRAGRRLVVSVAASALVQATMKLVVGRARPNADLGAFTFHPFNISGKDTAGIANRGSMPSGHVTAAFAVATSLADDVNNLPLKIAVFTFATGTAFSRIYENRHWLSDTVMGAILGVTTAKLVGGHWRIFNLKPPGFLVTPTGAPAISWNIPFSTSPHSPSLAMADSVATQ
jgi:membrane-associated phospholipid phosphatase